MFFYQKGYSVSVMVLAFCFISFGICIAFLDTCRERFFGAWYNVIGNITIVVVLENFVQEKEIVHFVI